MFRRLIVVWFAMVLGGCATAISSGTSTVDLLDLDAARGDGLAYALLDGSRQPIARSVSRDGRIRFELPADRTIGRCVVVLDNAGQTALGERPAIHLALREQYQAIERERRQLAADEASAVAVATLARRDGDAVRARLEGNPAHVGGACRQPADLPAPPRPATQCGSRQDCLRDGAAICFTRQYGVSGCERAAKELGLPGLGSNPGCKPAEAARASRGIDGVIFDALQGAAANAARTLQGSDDAAEKAIGGMMANASDYARISSARSCTDAFVERELAPIEAWTARVRQLRDEPRRLLEDCEAGTVALRDIEQQRVATAARSSEIVVQTRSLDGQLEALRLERRAIEWCESEPVAVGRR